ncbi:MAG TPA: phosphoenolpyruvate--protein phosphotransferase [Anaerolineales bacterium]|nr:phosphoenolpyruvate--protein phosphotransferase [Anaerolineales bacterium]
MAETTLQGIAASSGIAIGPAYCYVPADLSIPARPCGPAEQELARFGPALEQARRELQDLHDSLVGRTGEAEAAIFEAQQMMLEDPTLEEKVREGVEAGQIIEQAVVRATDSLAGVLAAMPDPLFAGRAADVRDVGARILRILLELPDLSLGNVREPCIVVARDLTPSDTASLDPKLTLGFCTEAGGLTSHSAILARTLGIPAIVALGEGLLRRAPTGTPLVLDGETGKLLVSASGSTIEQYERARQEREVRRREVAGRAAEPARTANGRRVEVGANIGDAASARDAVANGAEGVGLLRTEFLYLDQVQPPSEENQLSIYGEIFKAMGPRPLIVRTLDIGGDKPPSYLPFPSEMNPFLGWRAIRISLDRPDLFKTQLRAILRAAVGYQARIMFPMVSDLAELRRARQLVEEVKAELKQEGLQFAEDVPVGIMVETPAAAVLVDVLSEAADFFSLGTNDLTQYTLAVDRGNATVAALYQPLHPAVLRLIQQTIKLAHAKGKWVGMCGELAGMAKAIPILLGLGLDEFSMNPRAIPDAKHLIRQLDDGYARKIAKHALKLNTAVEIDHYMQEILQELQMAPEGAPGKKT